MNYFSGLRPADRFRVSSNYVATQLTEDVLKRLYIPLIGLESVAVYQYLSQFVGMNQLSDEKTHYLVLNELKMNLSEFSKLRAQLEAIGLMKTYMKVDEEQSFIYKLLQPVMPAQFFNDPMLSVFLYQVAGKARYLELKEYFCSDLIDTKGYSDVSKNYIDVFGTPKAPNKEIYEGNERLIRTYDSQGIPVHQQHFDFDLLELLLSQNLITKEQLTKETRELIAQVSMLYDISPADMRRIILKSLTTGGRISHENLRKNARDYYQIEHAGKLPELKVQQEEVPETTETKLSWFEMLDTTSPIEMLTGLSQSEPTTKQKRMIETILEREKLPFGVMNILLQYVLFTHEMKLPQSYIEEIASNWKKLKLSSSKAAYDHVKQIQAKSQTKREQPAKRDYKRGKEMPAPDWIKQMAENEDEMPKETQDDAALEADKKALQEQLNNFWKEDE